MYAVPLPNGDRHEDDIEAARIEPDDERSGRDSDDSQHPPQGGLRVVVARRRARTRAGTMCTASGSDAALDSPTVPDTAVLRFVYRGRIRWALPHWVVEETPTHVVLGLVPGVIGKGAEDYGEAEYFDQLATAWTLVDRVWERNRLLRFTPREASYSVDHYWREDDGEFLGYQINFQDTLRRTAIGFDTFDHEIDIVVRPDGSWHWKDVDSFERGVRNGVISNEDGTTIRELSRAVAGQIGNLVPTGWESWQPDPAWPLPELPVGWDAHA
jgi:uncharacterized protein DUF402